MVFIDFYKTLINITSKNGSKRSKTVQKGPKRSKKGKKRPKRVKKGPKRVEKGPKRVEKDHDENLLVACRKRPGFQEALT